MKRNSNPLRPFDPHHVSQSAGHRGSGPAAGSGFTIAELLAVLGALALLALVAMPALASTKWRSQRAGCVSNLSRIGVALNMWAGDHGNRYHFWVDAPEGGIRNQPSGLQHNLWFNYVWISNELVTPRVLVCPSDVKKRIALEWSGAPQIGIFNNGNQDNSVSFLMFHPLIEDGRGPLCADRSLKFSSLAGGTCATGWRNPAEFSASEVEWLPRSDYGHGNSGSMLFNDGSVDELDTVGARQALRLGRTFEQSERYHSLYPGGL